MDKDEGCGWAEIGSKDGVNGEVRFNLGGAEDSAEDTELKDEMAAWLCSVTPEVSFTADSGVTIGSLCNDG